jgi:hypothetical protein
MRRHLGFERQWKEVEIRGTTPALLGLFSLVTWGKQKAGTVTSPGSSSYLALELCS